MRIETIKDKGKRMKVGADLDRLDEYAEEDRVEKEKHTTRLAAITERREEVLRHLAIDLGKGSETPKSLLSKIDLEERTIEGIDKLG